MHIWLDGWIGEVLLEPSEIAGPCKFGDFTVRLNSPSGSVCTTEWVLGPSPLVKAATEQL